MKLVDDTLLGKVKQGEVVINSIIYLHKGKDISVIRIETATRNPYLAARTSSALYLLSSEPRKTKDKRKLTVVHFNIPEDWSWEMVVSADRDGLTVCICKHASDGEVIWYRDED